jgi:Fic family protein
MGGLMFEPTYHISAQLLANISRISVLLTELRFRPLTGPVVTELARRAVTLSAHTSTRIEGNPLPLTEVKRLLKRRPEHLGESEREVVNYNDALVELNALVEAGEERLTTERILSIHAVVLRDLEEPDLRGRLRAEPVVVNDPRNGQTIYLPPDHGDVAPLLSELLEFIADNQERLDPLVLAGLFHRQFVIIHPFGDGNGRTARLATKLLLAALGVDTFPIFSFENYYNKNVSRYFAAVGVAGNYYEIQDSIDFTQWLEYFTEGIINELLRVGADLALVAASPATTLQRHHKRLLAYIQEHGYITDREYAKLTDRAKATRALDFRRLMDWGLVDRHGKGRSTYYRLAGG